MKNIYKANGLLYAKNKEKSQRKMVEILLFLIEILAHNIRRPNGGIGAMGTRKGVPISKSVELDHIGESHDER